MTAECLDETPVPQERWYVRNSDPEIRTTDRAFYLNYAFQNELRLPLLPVCEWPETVTITGVYEDGSLAPSEEINVREWVAARRPAWLAEGV